MGPESKLYQMQAQLQEHAEQFRQIDLRFERLIASQERNTQAISHLIEETRDIIQLHKDIQGATRLGAKVQDFGVWLARWGVIGTAIYAALRWTIDNAPPWH